MILGLISINMPVKTDSIKDVGKEIFRKYNHGVSTDFNQNKELVNKVTNIQSKGVRNQVAGYLVSLKVRQIHSESSDS